MFEKDLDLFLIEVVERGLHFNPDGFVHTHNKRDPRAPRPPMKFMLCTPEVRPEARMTFDDVALMGEFCWRYAKKHKLDIRAIAGIPRVGDEIAKAIQQAAERDDVNLPRLAFHKNADGTIGRLVRKDGYPKGGPLWFVDDLTQFGISKKYGFDAAQRASYSVAGLLTFLDYGKAHSFFRDLGIKHHYVASVQKTLGIGLQKRRIKKSAFDAIHAYLKQPLGAAA